MVDHEGLQEKPTVSFGLAVPDQDYHTRLSHAEYFTGLKQ